MDPFSGLMLPTQQWIFGKPCSQVTQHHLEGHVLLYNVTPTLICLCGLDLEAVGARSCPVQCGEGDFSCFNSPMKACVIPFLSSLARLRPPGRPEPPRVRDGPGLPRTPAHQACQAPRGQQCGQGSVPLRVSMGQAHEHPLSTVVQGLLDEK